MAERPNPREHEAGLLVAKTLGGQLVWKDRPGAPDGTHDFDVLLPDGKRIALEVTTSTIESVLSLWDAVGKRSWEAPSLRALWFVRVPYPQPGMPAVRIGQLHKRVETLLAVLEADDVWNFGPGYAPMPSAEPTLAVEAAFSDLQALGVMAATAISLGEGYIGIGTVGGGGSVDPTSLNGTATAHVKANLDKLARAEADERHLIVWIDAIDFSGEWAMAFDRVPAEPPALVPEVRTVWVAKWSPGASEASNAAKLWRATPPDNWEALEVPAVLADLPRS